jgi:hypothetical protein
MKTDYAKANKKQIVEIKGRRIRKEVVQYLVKWKEVDELVWCLPFALLLPYFKN